MGPIGARVAVSTEPPVHVVRSVILSGKLTQPILATQRPCAFPCFGISDLDAPVQRYLLRFDPPMLIDPTPAVEPAKSDAARSLDAPEDLPKQAVRQVALGQLEDKSSRHAGSGTRRS
jgi:hypothetical protein